MAEIPALSTKRIVTAAVVLGLGAAAALAWYYSSGIPVDVTAAERRLVREYIVEDGETRLDDTYVIDMPVNGTVEEILVDVGARVGAGDLLVRIDPFALRQQMEGVKAMIGQARARITGVDISKPKPEELAAARMRVREIESSLAAAERDRDIAGIQLADAQREFNRMDALYREGAVSQRQYENAERGCQAAHESLSRAESLVEAARRTREIASLESARLESSVDDNEFQREALEAEINNLRSEVEILQSDLGKTEVRAPVDGVVLDRQIESRRVLGAGTPLMTLGDTATIEIECDVLSEEVVNIGMGDPVEITGEALHNQIVMGTVDQIYPSGFEKISALGIEQQRVKTIIAFDNSELGLRPGTSVELNIVTDERADVVAVPERATFRHEDGWAVFRVAGGRARLTPVTIGLKNDDWAEIIEGVTSGDPVIAEPGNDLTDSARVTTSQTN